MILGYFLINRSTGKKYNSKNASNPESHAYNFEYFDWNNYKIDKIKLEANKKLLILVFLLMPRKNSIFFYEFS